MKRIELWAVSLSIVLTAMPAQAYIGLGPGLSMLGSFLTLLAGVVVALVMVFTYPIRMWLYNRRKRAQDADPE